MTMLISREEFRTECRLLAYTTEYVIILIRDLAYPGAPQDVMGAGLIDYDSRVAREMRQVDVLSLHLIFRCMHQSVVRCMYPACNDTILILSLYLNMWCRCELQPNNMRV
jgi:hypothetical protein